MQHVQETFREPIMTDPGKGPAIQLFGKEGGKNIQLKKETYSELSWSGWDADLKFWFYQVLNCKVHFKLLQMQYTVPY